MSSKAGGSNKKHGRNKVKCARYAQRRGISGKRRRHGHQSLPNGLLAPGGGTVLNGFKEIRACPLREAPSRTTCVAQMIEDAEKRRYGCAVGPHVVHVAAPRTLRPAA